MNQLEQDTLNAVKRAAMHLTNKDINWEERRYEIAKEVISIMRHDDPQDMAKAAVEVADALIEELRKNPKF